MHSSCDGYRSALAYSSSRAPLTASRPDSARLTYPWETAVSPASDDMAAATSTCVMPRDSRASTSMAERATFALSLISARLHPRAVTIPYLMPRAMPSSMPQNIPHLVTYQGSRGLQACVNRSIAPWCKSVVVRRRPPRRNAAQDRSAGLALGRGRCARSQRRQRLCERAGSGAASGWGGSRIVDTNLCCSLDALTWGSRRSGGGAGSPWAGVACGAGEGFAGGAPRGWGAGSAGLGCLLAAPGGVLQLTPD